MQGIQKQLTNPILSRGVNMEILSSDEVTFYQLDWDTDFFGVTSAKAILHKPLTNNSWKALKSRFRDYQFISIENKNSEPINAQFIGKFTNAFLADVNIQFEKQLTHIKEQQENIRILSALEKNDQILTIADFKFSKFTEDPELFTRGGDQVYKQWLRNSFGDENKYYAISADENKIMNGFLLHSYTEDACIIELIAVAQTYSKGGIGTKLFQKVEIEAYKRGFHKIKVGTQVRNMGAINFYQNVGCRQVGCHQIYHLWL